MKQKILTLILLSVFLVPIVNAQINEYPQITDQSCDAMNPCHEGLECFSFSGIGLRCAQPNPCSYFKCPDGTQCSIAESYPSQVMCFCVGPECPAAGGDEDTVGYNLSTQTAIHLIKPDGQTASHNISLWKTTDENRGILETNASQAEYSSSLVVENSELLMKTSIGKKQINVLPEDAIGISETPDKEAVEKIELREESQRPVYSVIGTKQARLLFIVPVSLEVETKIDAETSKIISVTKPWWSFLAW